MLSNRTLDRGPAPRFPPWFLGIVSLDRGTPDPTVRPDTSDHFGEFELGPENLGFGHVRAFEVGVRKIAVAHVGTVQVCISQNRLVEIASDFAKRKIRFSQIGVHKSAAIDLAVSKLDSGRNASGKVRKVQIRIGNTGGNQRRTAKACTPNDAVLNSAFVHFRSIKNGVSQVAAGNVEGSQVFFPKISAG